MASSQPDPLFDGDSDSDINSDIKSVASTISLTSTVEEYDPEKEYPVEAILAEKDDEEGKGLEYLIKWGGYEMHECTWEPAAMFSDKIVLNEWKDTKMQVLRGLKDKRGRKYKDWHAYNDSNIIAFEEAYMKWGKAKKDRRLKRRAKRIRLGLPVKVESDTEQEESDSDTDDDESDEQPIIVPKPRQSTNESRLKVASGNVAKERDSKPAASVAAPNPVRKGSMPFIEESSSGDDDEGKRDARRPLPRKALSRRASSADLSGDSLMEELKQQKKSRAEPTRGMLKRKTVDAAGHSSASTDARPPKQKSSKLPSQREGNRQPSNMGNGESSTDSDAPLVPNRTTQKIRKPIDGTVDRPQKVETQVNRPPQLSSSSDVPLSKEASKRSADIIRKTVDSNADPKSRSTLPTTASRAVPPAKDKPRVPQPSPSTAIAGASSGLKKKPPIAPPSKGPTASPLITDRPPPVRAPVPTQLKKPAVPGSSTEPRSSSSVNIRRPSVGALVSAQGAKPPENPPATMMKRTGGGGGIKMNMSAIPPPKPERKPTKQREYNSLSHQNNARKKAAQEGNPDPSVLEFIRTDRPSEASGTLGAPARKLSSTTTNPYSLRGNESAVLNRGEQTPPARELSSTTTNPYSLRGDERTALSRGEQAHQEEPTGHTHTVREDEKWKEQVTCFEWRNGTCRFNEKCRFLHRDVEFTSEDMKRVQKVGRVPLTCYFWWNNEDGCFKTSEACPFAHWNTGTVAGAPGHKDTETVDKFRLPPRTGGKLTCLAWLTHTCSFPGDHYPFMHSHVGSGPVGQTLQRRTSLPGVPQDAAGTSVQTTTRQPRIREPDPAEHMQRRKSLPRVLQDAGVSVNPATKQVKFNKPAPPLAMPQPLRALQQQMLEDVPHVKVRLVLPASKDGEVSEVDVLLMGLDVPSLDELRATLGAKPRLTISHNCSPAGWEAYCLEPPVPPRVTVGDVMPSLASDDALLETYARSLKRRGDLAGVISHERYTIIVYPAGQETWNFLNNFSFAMSPYESERKLRFNIRSSVPRLGAIVQTKNTAKPTDIQTKLQSGLKLDPDRLFSWIDGTLDKVVFLFFTEKNVQETKLVTMCLQGMGAKVFQDVTPGSWDYFRKNTKSGVIIFHPDIIDYHYRNLTQLRRCLKGRYNFFQVGKPVYDAADYEFRRFHGILMPENLPPWEYACKKLFPGGSLILITDDLFAHQPVEAWKLVQDFMRWRLLRNLPEGVPLNHKLVGRPGLIMWLQDLVNENEGEAKTLHDARVNLVEAFRNDICPPQWCNLLCGPEYMPDNPDYTPNKFAQVIAWAPIQWPEYQKLWQDNPAKATDALVNWFAEDVCEAESIYCRRFLVCHPFKMHKWLDEFAHIMDVDTPDMIRKTYIRPQGRK